MKELGKAEEIEEFEEQLDYLGDILYHLEDLAVLYKKDPAFKDNYKEIKDLMNWIDDTYTDLEKEKEELEQIEAKREEEELKAMNEEFERSRL